MIIYKVDEAQVKTALGECLGIEDWSITSSGQGCSEIHFWTDKGPSIAAAAIKRLGIDIIKE